LRRNIANLKGTFKKYLAGWYTWTGRDREKNEFAKNRTISLLLAVERWSDAIVQEKQRSFR